MVRPQKSATSRACTAMVALALTTGGVAFVATPLSASAGPVDTQLVVTDVSSADSQDLSAASLRTVNISGAKSFAKPVSLPTADSGSNKAFTLSGNSDGNGSLSRSADENYLTIGGYAKAPGPTGFTKPDPKDTKATEIPRVVARIAKDGTVDTSTVLGGLILSESHPRSVASADGSSFYVAGNGGKDTPKSGVVKVDFGTTNNKVAIGSLTQTNLRAAQIADGGLYAISEKASLAGLGKFAGGLPTTTTALTTLATISTVDLPVPIAFTMVDANPDMPGVDTAYVVVQAGGGSPNEIRKYTSDGAAWTLNGTKAGVYQALTARKGAGKVELFAVSGTSVANTMVSFDDNSLTGSFDPGAETTLATAATGHAFRGVSFAPTGWDPGTISTDAPTASVASSTVGGTLGDTHNPTSTVTLADDDTDAGDLTLTAQSSDQGVVPDANITLTGTGLTRTASYEPTGRGRSNIEFTVTDDNANSTTETVAYAASTAPTSTTGRYLYESSDLSSAVDAGDGYSLAISSEDHSIRLYKQGESGRPVYTYDFDGDIGAPNADIEGMAKVNDVLYILGSHGNNKDGEPKESRRVLFTATLGGSGASTTVTYVGKFNGLWDDLRTWDQANGNRLGFAIGQANGKAPNDPDGFNIEGLEFAPGSESTAYLGFRSPIVMHAGKPSAVIVPLTNADKLTGTATPATFGDPIYLDLGGRTIRDIRKNSHDEYLISAVSGNGTPNWALFAWDGRANNTPIKVKDLPDPDPTTTGSWESIVAVPHPLSAGGSVSSITDSGNTTYYNATEGENESKGLSKSYIDDFATSPFLSYPTTPANVTTTAGPGSVNVSWDSVSTAASYNVTVKNGGTNVSASPKSVTAGTSTTLSGLDSTKTYAVTVTAVNGSGESGASAPINAIPDFDPTPPFGTPTDFVTTAQTSSTITLTWTKSTDATKYRIYSGIGTGTRTRVDVGNTNTTTITGLKPKTKYMIDISAFKSDGTQSKYTPRLPVSTQALRAPTGLAHSSHTASRITVKWTKVPGVSKYRISWGIGTGSRSTLVVGNVSTATLIGLKRGKTYTISIASLSADKSTSSGYSPRISVKTSSLLPPTSFASSARTSSTVKLAWKKAVNAKGYRVGYGIGTGPRTKVVVSDVSTMTLPGLKSGAKYTIDIASLEGDGVTRSIYTSKITVTTR